MAQNAEWQRLADSEVVLKDEGDDVALGNRGADGFGGHGWGDAGTGSNAAYALFC
jgi:hypothetical protein